MTTKETKELLARSVAFVNEHRDSYLRSGGRAGHIIDCTAVGARGYLPSLLLQTIGRKSGKPHIVPLLYGCFAGEWLVVGSRGGAPEHPAWFLNLQSRPEVHFQIATQAFRGSWRIPVGEERDQAWAYVTGMFPAYAEYQKRTERQIPVVLLRPIEETPVFEPRTEA